MYFGNRLPLQRRHATLPAPSPAISFCSNATTLFNGGGEIVLSNFDIGEEYDDRLIVAAFVCDAGPASYVSFNEKAALMHVNTARASGKIGVTMASAIVPRGRTMTLRAPVPAFMGGTPNWCVWGIDAGGLNSIIPVAASGASAASTSLSGSIAALAGGLILLAYGNITQTETPTYEITYTNRGNFTGGGYRQRFDDAVVPADDASSTLSWSVGSNADHAFGALAFR